MRNKYFWQGEPVKTDFGVVSVIENISKPLYWYNFECCWNIEEQKPRRGIKNDRSALIPAIKITTKENQIFYIANHFGIGAHKLKNGGWPNYRHFSFDDKVDFQGCEELGHIRSLYNLRTFYLKGYDEHERARRKWQKETYPKEFAKSEQLRKLIQKK
ncbi:hypothetical protein NAL32_07380 [Chryseobacterium sp. Ch-15]|uniref:Uncharacterized protein n=1 Tax=Chryseobacterium muglaense TaxID=2893752 RepID=A0A9Q3USR7_9FLAO|nr:hypothetical protein [Chryseobacterium muglaense]MBD3904452.1 hypothetical protein [Chryseobacterium muglaense]MCC9032729.1 hypothetical protein [Chryseobacterium muglaense]MCM2554214.1 hypothetical protein [Chryseobacterium muglaense]